MKVFFTLLLLALSVAAWPQAMPNAVQKGEAERRRLLANAADVSVSVSAAQAPSYQSRIWKAEALQSPTNAAAWLNLYLWAGRDKTLSSAEKRLALSEALSNAEKYVGSSSECFLIRYLHSDKKDSALLNKALALSGDKRQLYPYLVQWAVMTQNPSALLHYTKLLNEAQPLLPVFYEYHYNALMSADSNAVVYAQGLNDLVPLAVLQQAHGVRKDIRLKYFDGTANEPNAYLCLSLGKEALSAYPSAAYTGLLVKVGGAPPADALKSHLTKRFRFRIAGSNETLPPEAAALYRNYLPSLLLLYKDLKRGSEAEKWKGVLLNLAAQTGTTNPVRKAVED